ncbi:MAG: hypothetical protein H6733_16395 [Alphaproteobacteria bacterium]|nr:hypothetical protein [Alphaproteobacteria bacterium]
MRWLPAVLTLLTACGGAGEPPTYHADVRPILERSCTSCHVEGGIGPFAMDLSEAAWADGPPSWVPAAVAAIEAGTMPPWTPDPSCRSYVDARNLPEADKDTVAAWAAADFPVGDPGAYRAPDTAAKVELDAPDLDLKPAESYTADATRPDDYRCFVVDHAFDADAWVRAFTVVPDQVELVHHVILYRLAPGYAEQARQWDADDDGPGYSCFGSPGTWDADTLAGWAPGQNPEVYPEGIARRIEKGSTLVLQIHYNTLGRTEAPKPDRTGVQLWLLPAGETPTQQLVSYPLADTRLNIPAGDGKAVETEDFSFGGLPIDIPAIGVFPHMHQLGTRIRMDVVRDKGPKECVIDIPAWDFNWQQSYFFEDFTPITFGPDDLLRLKCTYDNSAGNQPVVNGEQLEPRDVHWGDGTLDEMCLMYAYILVPPGFF